MYSHSNKNLSPENEYDIHILNDIELTLRIAKNAYRRYQLYEERLRKLTILQEAILKKINNEAIDFNDVIKLYHLPNASEEHCEKFFLINVAVSYCSSRIVDYLLKNGAKVQANTLHCLAKFKTQADAHNIVKVLKKYQPNLNELYKGHTALFYAKRKKNHMASDALKKNGAELTGLEKLASSVLNTEDTEPAVNIKTMWRRFTN